MNNDITTVARTLQSAYNEQYAEGVSEWRELGAKAKAENIINLCKGKDFNKVLECGAGEGSILKWLDKADVFNDLYAVEISDSGIRQIENRSLDKLVEVRKFDGYHLPYSDDHFDMVYCSHVIEHVEHPRLLLREIRRVSKFQVFEVPLDYSINVDKKLKHFLSYGHINIYTPSLFKFLLKSEGFHIIDDLLTQTSNDVIRYNWYKNLKLKKTWKREYLLYTRNLRNFFKKLKMGEEMFNETRYSAYTCLTSADGTLTIF